MDYDTEGMSGAEMECFDYGFDGHNWHYVKEWLYETFGVSDIEDDSMYFEAWHAGSVARYRILGRSSI